MTNENSNTQAHTLEAKSEDKRQAAKDADIQQQAEKGRSQAQTHADAIQTLTEGLASHQQEKLTLARGQTVPEQLQNTEHQQHITDGLAVGVVAAGLAAKKVREIWQDRQENRINEALEPQKADPQVERENQVREQALQANLERWREIRGNMSELQNNRDVSINKQI